MRQGEVEGREYYFVDKSTFLDMIRLGELIEYRTYNTLVDNIPDTWYYGLTKQPFDSSKNYVVILDVQGCRDFINYVGEDNVEVYYIYCNDMIRTERAKARGSFNQVEWDRRLEDDARVFSKDNMVGINYNKVINQHRDINEVVKEIVG
jgi:guanylate kinase